MNRSIDEVIVHTPEDQVLTYVTEGWIAHDYATRLLDMPEDDRAKIATTLQEVIDQGVMESEQRRADWVIRMLNKPEVTPQIRTVFLQVAVQRPEMQHKAGLGDRHNTNGRHSSPYTFNSGNSFSHHE